MGSEPRQIRLLALATMLQKALDEEEEPFVSDEFKAALSALTLRLQGQIEGSHPHLHVVEDERTRTEGQQASG